MRAHRDGPAPSFQGAIQMFFSLDRHLSLDMFRVPHKIDQLRHSLADILETIFEDLLHFLFCFFPSKSDVQTFASDPFLTDRKTKTDRDQGLRYLTHGRQGKPIDKTRDRK